MIFGSNTEYPELVMTYTLTDNYRMKELDIYNWERYEKELKAEKSTYTENELKLIADAKELEKQKEKNPF